MTIQIFIDYFNYYCNSNYRIQNIIDLVKYGNHISVISKSDLWLISGDLIDMILI